MEHLKMTKLPRKLEQRISLKRTVTYDIGIQHHDWHLLLRLQHGKDEDGETIEGHRYWVRSDVATRPHAWPGNVSVADLSGDEQGSYAGTPEQTDDGILWLDYGRPIKIDKKGAASIPVISGRDGSLSRTPESFHDALLVAEKFGLEVRCEDFIIEPRRG